MIGIDDVGFRYPGVHAPALSHVSLSVMPGRVVALVGANGSGKSTVARLCNGLLIPESGSLLVDGIDTRDAVRAFDVRSRVGLVLQNPENQIVGTVVEEDVAFGPENLGVAPALIRERVDAAIAAVGLSGLERREPHLLSEGQKQRLAVAGVLALEPRYLVFDEPTALLDPQGRAEIRRIIRMLREAGHGILYITHHLEEVARADEVIALDHGEVAFRGAPGRLLGDAATLQRLGLEMPQLSLMALELRRLGVDVPLAVDDPAMLSEAICR